MPTECEMLTTGLRILEQYGVPVELEAIEPAAGQPGDRRPDARIRVRTGTTWRPYDVECKPTLKPGNLGAVAITLDQGERPGFVFTDYVTRPMADRLRDLGIPFVDMAGNAWLEQPPVVVRVEGRKPADQPAAPPRNRAFHPTGLKVVFALLCRPEAFRAPLRDIAELTGVAHGTVGWVMYGLREAGYLVERGKGRGRRRIPRDLLRLLDDWAAEYARNLRPRLLLGRYAPGPGTPADWWRRAPDDHGDILMGGEPAAAELTGYLQPGAITLYAQQIPGRLVAENRLQTDEEGPIEFRARFWPFEHKWERPDLTPPVLIYADLLATDEPRCIETARMIHEQYLAGPLGAY